MSFIRPSSSSLSLARAGLGVRHLHASQSARGGRLQEEELMSTARVTALRASRARMDAVASANETGGFPYVPGGRTVNDATTFPPPSKSHGSYHWAFERLLSASLIPVMGAAAVSSGSAYAALDGILAVSLIVHSHIGFDSCIIDYLHPRKFPILGPLATWLLRAATGLAVWGVYEFNTNDIGLTELVRRSWTA